MVEIAGNLSEGKMALEALKLQLGEIRYSYEDKPTVLEVVDSVVRVGFNTKDADVAVEAARVLGGFLALQPDNKNEYRGPVQEVRGKALDGLSALFFKDRGDKDLSLAVINGLAGSMIYVHDVGASHTEAVWGLAYAAYKSYYPEVKERALTALGEYCSRKIGNFNDVEVGGYNAYSDTQTLANRLISVLGVSQALAVDAVPLN